MSALRRLADRMKKFEVALRQEDREALARAAHACRVQAFRVLDAIDAMEQKRLGELRPEQHDAPT
jgi:hypothetical protein